MNLFHSKGFPVSRNTGLFQTSQKYHYQDNNNTITQFWCIPPMISSWIQRWPPLNCWSFPKRDSEPRYTHLRQHTLEKENGTLWKDYMQHNTRQGTKHLWLKKERNVLFCVISKNGLDRAHQESSTIVLLPDLWEAHWHRVLFSGELSVRNGL